MNQEELEAMVVAECAKHGKENWQKIGFRPCLPVGTYFVKYGNRINLEPELATQAYIFNYAQSMPDVPRIPKVVHHFVHEHFMYLVLEHIKLEKSPADLSARIEMAVKWLSEVPAPPNQTLGPVGGGPIRHRFFQDYMAPLDFPNIKILNQYIQKASRLLPPGPAEKRLSPINICGDRLMFSQSDMDDSNFGVDEHGRTVLMNFSMIGWLPETFVAHTLYMSRSPRSIAISLGLSDNPNMASMTAIFQCLWMVSDPNLGFDSEGSKVA